MIARKNGCHSYSCRFLQIGAFAAVFHLILAIAPLTTTSAGAAPVRIVAFGDSLTAGYRLAPGEAFPNRLEKALRDKGVDARVENAGVSGDTTAAGLARLDWGVPAATDIVILQLGANDALRGIDPKVTRSNLDSIIRQLKTKGAKVLLAGMLAPRNLGEDYARRFDAIFPELAEAHGLALYPFFLEGIALRPDLNLDDGMHPNARGVDVIVAQILPYIDKLVQAATNKP